MLGTYDMTMLIHVQHSMDDLWLQGNDKIICTLTQMVFMSYFT